MRDGPACCAGWNAFEAFGSPELKLGKALLFPPSPVPNAGTLPNPPFSPSCGIEAECCINGVVVPIVVGEANMVARKGFAPPKVPVA